MVSCKCSLEPIHWLPFFNLETISCFKLEWCFCRCVVSPLFDKFEIRQIQPNCQTCFKKEFIHIWDHGIGVFHSGTGAESQVKLELCRLSYLDHHEHQQTSHSIPANQHEIPWNHHESPLNHHWTPITFNLNHHLVGGLEHQFYFPINIGNVIIPIDEVIFFRGVAQPPTSH